MTNADPLPSSATEVTPEWLTKVMQASNALRGGHVTAIRAADLTGSVALMSHMLRLHISYNSRASLGPQTLIAKFPPQDEGQYQRGLDLGFFEGEAGFYRELAHATGMRTPRCYFSRFDPDTGHFLILLEDLGTARLGDVRAGCSESEAFLAIDSLARLHASWWNSSSLNDFGWLAEFEERAETVYALLPEAWPTFESRFRGILGAGALTILAEVSDRFSRSERIRLGQVRTLLHGDFKLDNLFFTRSGELVVCDWGLVMAGPAIFDVASFLAVNLTEERRRQLETVLIHRYVETLESAGVRDCEFAAARDEYKPQLIAFLPRLIVAGGLAEFANERAIEEYAMTLRRVVAAISEHGGLENVSWV